jgi:chaperonin GroEL (HSP60 family)
MQVKEPRVLYGGGWPEMRMAHAIEEAAKTTPGVQQGVLGLGFSQVF